MKISKKIILLVLTLSVLFAFSCKTNEKKNSAATPNADLNTYNMLAEAMTKQCPLVDGILRLDSVQYEKKERALIYNHSIINMKKSDLPGKSLDIVRGTMRDMQLSDLKSKSSMLDMFRKDEIKLVYNFKDMEGNDFFAFDFKHTEY